MGSESIDHEVKGHMGYWLKGHESKRNNNNNSRTQLWKHLTKWLDFIKTIIVLIKSNHLVKCYNCFNKIQPFGQMLSQLCTWIRKPLIKKSRKINNVDIEWNNKVNKTLIEFNYFRPNCLDTSRLLSVTSNERRLYSKAEIIRDNTRRPC